MPSEAGGKLNQHHGLRRRSTRWLTRLMVVAWGREGPVGAHAAPTRSPGAHAITTRHRRTLQVLQPHLRLVSTGGKGAVWRPGLNWLEGREGARQPAERSRHRARTPRRTRLIRAPDARGPPSQAVKQISRCLAVSLLASSSPLCPTQLKMKQKEKTEEMMVTRSGGF